MNVSAQVRPTKWLTVNGRGETYKYQDAEVSTALVPQLEDGGWRTRLGATANLRSRWTLDGSYGIEHGPGAAARSFDASVSFSPSGKIVLDAYAGALSRPLELRYYDATSRWIGGRAQWQRSDQLRLWSDVAIVSDDRDRPDANATSLSQVRARAGVSVTFGSGADRTPLPPARPALR